MSDDESGWEDYETGPFCRHWSDPADCAEVCQACGHRCGVHDFGDGAATECNEPECDCKEWTAQTEGESNG